MIYETIHPEVLSELSYVQFILALTLRGITPLSYKIYFFCGGMSVQEPWAISAAIPTDSPRVG